MPVTACPQESCFVLPLDVIFDVDSVLPGGEIFLRNDIVELVRFASSNDILMGMVSNGTLIDEGMARELIEAGLSFFDISIDGIRPETHDYIRGASGTYEKAMATIHYLKKYNKEMNGDLSIVVATVILRTNMHELADIVRWAQSEELDGVMFGPLALASDSDSQWFEKSDLWPQENDLYKLEEVLVHIVAMKREGARILNSVDQFLEIKNYFRNPSVPRGASCRAGTTTFLISCDGDINPCFRVSRLGNVREPFKEIWNSEQARTVRKMIKQCRVESGPGNHLYRRSLIEETKRYLKYR